MEKELFGYNIKMYLLFLMNKDRDRISVDLKGLRERIEAAAIEPGQSIASGVRRIAYLGMELIEVCRKLKIPPPGIGEIEQWLIGISGIPENANNETLPGLVSQLSMEEIADSNIPIERVLAIKRGETPEPHEITKLARILGRSPSQIKEIADKGKANGYKH